MTRLEDRVREACREAADTVRPETIRGLDLEADGRAAGTQLAVRTRRPGRVLAPLAAAAAVAVIAVGARPRPADRPHRPHRPRGRPDRQAVVLHARRGLHQ